MKYSTRWAIGIYVLGTLIAAGGCSDDPAIPTTDTERLRIELLSPYDYNDTPEAAFVVRVEANAPLQRVVFSIDGVDMMTDDTAPFEYLWNIALQADGERHSLWAEGYDEAGRSDGQGASYWIPEGSAGVLLDPIAGRGVLDPAATALRWIRDPQATEYEVALSLQPDFTETAQTTTTTDTTVVLPATGQRWQYWRLRQRMDDGPWGEWSETAVFFGGVIFERAHVYNGANKSDARAVEQTADGGYVLAGSYFGRRPLVRRLGPLGDSLWTYEPYFQGHYHDLVLTDDGGCVVLGVADDDAVLTRLDEQGQEVWSRPHFGAEYEDYGYCLNRCFEGGFVVAGRMQDTAWLLRVDDSGRLMWQQTYDLTSANAVVGHPDGGFVLVADNGYQTFLLGTDESGHEQWRTQLTGWADAGSGLEADETGFMALDENGGMHRFSLDGQHEWTVWLDGNNGRFAMDQTAGGGYVVVNGSSSSYMIVNLDASGNELWRRLTDGRPLDVCSTEDGGYMVVGYDRQPSTQNHMWVLKTNGAGESSPPERD